MRRIKFFALLSLLFFVFFCGCSKETSLQAPKPGGGARRSTRQVLTPSAPGTVIYESEDLLLDASNTDQGYLMVKWLKEESKIKLQMSGPSNITYTYNLPADNNWHVYPFTQGSGSYTINIYENLHDNQYYLNFSQKLSAVLTDELTPFLYPNEYVNFNEQTQAVTLAEELAADSDDDLDVISSVFYYIVTNISYDYEKAASVKSGYTPVIDETLESQSGICMDYAALMTCMLRSQQIPAKLEVGYTGDVYHAWISAWVKDKGWIYNLIEFDGTSWNMMDPTFASTESQGKDLSNYIKNDDSYFIKYSY
ncbi:MAG: transglutaminase domain-containing protein [Lachnospiraceae bacterium]|nr:transglutaminase domain-containing protein [Lachnospiraceae bacterium]